VDSARTHTSRRKPLRADLNEAQRPGNAWRCPAAIVRIRWRWRTPAGSASPTGSATPTGPATSITVMVAGEPRALRPLRARRGRCRVGGSRSKAECGYAECPRDDRARCNCRQTLRDNPCETRIEPPAPASPTRTKVIAGQQKSVRPFRHVPRSTVPRTTYV
jgi:hypothetical protein